MNYLTYMNIYIYISEILTENKIVANSILSEESAMVVIKTGYVWKSYFHNFSAP
jgi:hypothetical protein